MKNTAPMILLPLKESIEPDQDNDGITEEPHITVHPLLTGLKNLFQPGILPPCLIRIHYYILVLWRGRMWKQSPIC